MNLEDAPAPDDHSEGWKPDPLGASDWRWWDGTTWTDRVGASQQAAATPVPASGSSVPPTKLCRHCGSQSQTADANCPNCGKSYKKKRTGLKILVGLAIAGLVFVVGCTAIVIVGVGDAVDELNEEQQRHAITRTQFNDLEIGMTQQEVRESTGKEPEDRQNFQSEGFLDEEPSNSSCIYYNKDGGEFLDSYQLCFDEGKLTSKNEW